MENVGDMKLSNAAKLCDKQAAIIHAIEEWAIADFNFKLLEYIKLLKEMKDAKEIYKKLKGEK